jgi:chromosomal replication initiator protein
LQSIFWEKILSILEQQDVAGADFSTYLLPLQARQKDEDLTLYAPNDFVKKVVTEKYLDVISSCLAENFELKNSSCKVLLGSAIEENNKEEPDRDNISASVSKSYKYNFSESPLNKDYTFESFIPGSSNEMARAAAFMVGDNPGAYNPLLIYGASGLGKSHLLHSVGHKILSNKDNAKVKFLSSERFVSEMVNSIQRNKIEEFKSHFRSLDVLLLDDVQFFAKKTRSQEELFHILNALLDGKGQIVLTSDCHPKEQDGFEERLRSRFCWGLAVGVEPPELETRVAILINKALAFGVELPQEVAFFIAEQVASNVRELEGALKKVIASAHFMGSDISLAFAKEALKDLLHLQSRSVTIEDIQKAIISYYNIKSSDLLGPQRRRSIARPRQVAMALAKKITNKSLPEIGLAFGGRDHTTVLYACKKISSLLLSDSEIKEDYENLLRRLSG